MDYGQKDHWIKSLGGEIAMRVSKRAIADAEEFKLAYLDNDRSRAEYTEEELDLMSAAFLVTAGRLPIFSYDLIRWTVETRLFDGRAAIREYAEKELGMVDGTVPKPCGSRQSGATAHSASVAKLEKLERAMSGATVEQAWVALTASFDGDELVAIMERVQAEVLTA